MTGIPGVARVAAGAILWAVWPCALRGLGMEALHGALVALVVMALPAPLMLRRSIGQGRVAEQRSTARRGLLALVLVGLADAGNVGFLLSAVHRGPVAVAVVAHYIGPPLVALAAPLLAGGRISRVTMVSALVVVGALAFASEAIGSAAVRPGAGDGPALAGSVFTTAALGGASGLFFAALILASQACLRTFRPIESTVLHAPISIVVLVAFAGPGVLPDEPAKDILLAAGVAAVSCLGGNLLFQSGLRQVGSVTAAGLTYLEPVTAIALAWAFLGEHPSAIALAALSTALGASLLTIAAGGSGSSSPRRQTEPSPRG